MASIDPNSNVPNTVPPGVANGPQFLGHPRGLFLLFLVEMWERFSYYGMRGLLILYLASVLSVHHAPQGVTENTLLFTQIRSVDDPANPGTKKDEEVEYRRKLNVIHGPGEPAAASPESTGGLAVRIAKQTAANAGPEAPKNAKAAWIDDAADQGGVSVVRVDGDTATGIEHRFRVTNPTSETFKVTAEIERQPNKPGGDVVTQTYFKINDSSSVVSFDVKPDAQRTADDPPYDFVIEANTGDSGRNWTDGAAQDLYGWYTAMAYLLPILGGLIADKLIGTHRSMVVGSLLIALGHVVLGVSGFGKMAFDTTGMAVFVMGLALITIGTGHFKPCVSIMVGQLYELNDPRRESAFSIFYMGINLGAFLCNIVCGLAAQWYGWHVGFAIAAGGMIAGLILYLIAKPKYLPGVGVSNFPERAGKAWMFFPIGIIAAAGVGVLFSMGVLAKINQVFSDYPALPLVLAAAALVWVIVFISKQIPQDRGPVATIFLYMLFNAIFWLSFEQAGSSLNLFTDRYTDRSFGSGEVPTPFFQSINALLIILLAPIFGIFWANLARKKKYVPQPVKIGLGLIFVGLGYVVMVLAAMQLNSGIAKVSMIYICGLYFLHTVGEIILSPTGLSYVSKTAPKQHISGLMGIWFFSSFIANLGAGKVAKMVEPIIAGDVKLPWNLGGQADFFLLFVITSCAAGLLIILLAPILMRLQRNRND